MYPAGTPRGECGPVRPFPHCIAEGLPLRVQAEARAHSCSRPRQTVPPPGGCGGLRCAAGGSYALPLHARVRAESAPRAQPSGSMPRRRGACTPVTPSQRAAQHVCAAARRARGRAGRRTRATPSRAKGGPCPRRRRKPPRAAPFQPGAGERAVPCAPTHRPTPARCSRRTPPHAVRGAAPGGAREPVRRARRVAPARAAAANRPAPPRSNPAHDARRAIARGTARAPRWTR